MFERGEAVTTEPFQRYEGQRLATTTPQQQAAYQGVEQMVGGYKPYIATADFLTTQAAQQSTDPTAIASRMSPYQQAVVDIQKREALRDANKLQQQIGASAVGAGAFGGSRQALAETELARQTGQRLADIQAVGSQQAFQQAMNQLSADRAASLAAGQQFAGLGAQQQQLGLAGLGALETVGGTQQAQQQKALDIAYEDFARETTYPQQQLQEMSSVLRGFNLPVSTYTTSQAQQAPPTFGQQAAGLGLGALGIYGAGKGVGLFAGGGDVPDNPGLKKLAAKAPQVVENMGFNPQEVINAYVGGKMNYDNGGSIYGVNDAALQARQRENAIRMLYGGDEEAYKEAQKEKRFQPLEQRQSINEFLSTIAGPRFEDFKDKTRKQRLLLDEAKQMDVMPTTEEKTEETTEEIIPKAKAAPRDKVSGVLPGGKVSFDTNVGDTGTGTGVGPTEFTTPTEVKLGPNVPESDPYEYNKDLMNRYLAEIFKEDTGGVDIGQVAASLGMIPALSGKSEDIAAAQKSAQNLAAIEMGREKARRDDMAKALSMGMSAEQFEKKFGIEKPYYEARAEEARATAKALSGFGGSGEKLGKFRKDIAEEILKTDYELQGLQLKIGKAPAGSQEKLDLEKEFNELLKQRIDERVRILTKRSEKGGLENYLLQNKMRSPSGTGYLIDQPPPKV